MNLSPCEFEQAKRYPSGKRDCFILDMPCGIEPLEQCKIRADTLTWREELK